MTVGPELAQAVVAETYGHPASRLEAKVALLDRRARLRWAARGFFPLIGGALLSLPIPAWHLVGVPGFLLAAFVLGFRRLRVDRVFGTLRGPCPACGGDQEIPPPAPARFPSVLPCPGCGAYLTLRLENAPGE